jgi:hypothetical protein
MWQCGRCGQPLADDDSSCWSCADEADVLEPAEEQMPADDFERWRFSLSGLMLVTCVVGFYVALMRTNGRAITTLTIGGTLVVVLLIALVMAYRFVRRMAVPSAEVLDDGLSRAADDRFDADER